MFNESVLVKTAPPKPKIKAVSKLFNGNRRGFLAAMMGVFATVAVAPGLYIPPQPAPIYGVVWIDVTYNFVCVKRRRHFVCYEGKPPVRRLSDDFRI